MIRSERPSVPRRSPLAEFVPDALPASRLVARGPYCIHTFCLPSVSELHQLDVIGVRARVPAEAPLREQLTVLHR